MTTQSHSEFAERTFISPTWNCDLDNKDLMIIGGTGSFGKALVTTLLERFKLRRLIVYSRDELKQFEMQQKWNGTEMRYFIFFKDAATTDIYTLSLHDSLPPPHACGSIDNLPRR